MIKKTFLTTADMIAFQLRNNKQKKHKRTSENFDQYRVPKIPGL